MILNGDQIIMFKPKFFSTMQCIQLQYMSWGCSENDNILEINCIAQTSLLTQNK